MKKIILAASAVLAVSGSAFAASDHYGSDGANQPAVTSTDNGHTYSIGKSEPVYRPAPADQTTFPGSDRDRAGNR